MELTILYRYERGYIMNCTAHLYLNVYKIIKVTEKGYWINDLASLGNKWVSGTSRKRFAYPTKEEAFENFKKRSERCAKIQEAQLSRTRLFMKASKPD